MDDDEVFAMVVAGAITLWGILHVLPAMGLTRLMRPYAGRAVLVVGMVWPWGVVWWVLTHFAAKDVRNDGAYLTLFMLAVGATETGILRGMSFMGIGWRADALERRNWGAVWVVTGALAGGMMLFAGANIGEGPTIWTTLGPAAVGLVAWGGMWLLVETAARVSESVTIERDIASGIRLGAGLAAMGLVLGRAVAGDWVSTEELISTLISDGWPVLVIGAAMILMEQAWKPRAGRKQRLVGRGILPAAMMLGAASGWVVWLGRW